MFIFNKICCISIWANQLNYHLCYCFMGKQHTAASYCIFHRSNIKNGTVYTWTQTLTDRTFEWNTAFRIHGIQAMPTTTNDYQWTQESELEAQNGEKKKKQTSLKFYCTTNCVHSCAIFCRLHGCHTVTVPLTVWQTWL